MVQLAPGQPQRAADQGLAIGALLQRVGQHLRQVPRTLGKAAQQAVVVMTLAAQRGRWGWAGDGGNHGDGLRRLRRAQHTPHQHLDAVADGVLQAVGRVQFGPVPAADAAERTHHAEGRYRGVSADDPARPHALGDQGAELGIDLARQGAQFAPARLGQRVFTDPDHAQTKVAGDDAGIQLHRLAQPLAAVQWLRRKPGYAAAQQGQSARHTLEQDLLLVGNVVVQRGLGDAQTVRDVVQRRALETLAREQARGGQKHRFGLGAALGLSLAAGAPGGGRGIGKHSTAVAGTPGRRTKTKRMRFWLG